MANITTLELTKDYLEFSAGHFTIFSATHREKMHGHNYNVYGVITAEINDNGMTFDYAIYKKKLLELCKKLNGYFLLPNNSPHLRLEEKDDLYYGYFHNEKIPFPKSDVLILPVKNVTIEELARWFIEQLTSESEEIKKHRIHGITIKVFSTPGVNAAATWEKTA